jgi:hypothetical protein
MTTTEPEAATELPEHPAKWSASVLAALADLVNDEADRLGRPCNVLDPFAGIGRARLAEAITMDRQHRVFGLELQHLWADTDPLTRQGDATAMPVEWSGMFDVVATSPCYGNRMADRHDAQDPCKVCDGSGCTVGAPECLGGHPDDGRDHRVCKPCRGSGVSLRHTYAHYLRRQGDDLAPGSAGGLQWGAKYRLLHADAITEMLRVLVPDGLLLVNMKNHVRGDDEQLVVEWWINALLVRGCRLQEVRRVDTPNQGHGANGTKRVDGEVVIAVRTPPAAEQGRLL